MKRFFIVLYFAVVMVLAFATIYEKYEGSAQASEMIYSAVWFHILWGLLVMADIYSMYKVRMWHRLSAMALHCSFIVILFGALLTSLLSSEQIIHLREGEDSKAALPFKVSLEKFELKNYPGTDRPQDFISHISYTDEDESGTYDVSMNHIFSHRGYRFYQMSYDDDMRGTFLTVRHDPYGVGVTYMGYILLLLSILWYLADRNGRFRNVLRECMSKGILVLLLMLSVPENVVAQDVAAPRAISAVKAGQFARKLVVYNGRIVPIRTLALDFCQKVTGKRNFGGLSAERFMLSLMLYPEDWRNVRMVKIEDKALREALGIKEKYGAMSDFFALDGTYRMSALYQKHKSTDDAMEKAILKVDERCALVVMLLNGELVKPVPDGVEKPSEALINAELLYDAVPWSLILFICTFLLAIVSIVLMIANVKEIFSIALGCLVLVDAVALVILYVLRWMIQGHVPLSNGYETMLFIALVTLLLSAVMTLRNVRRVGLLNTLGLIVTAFALLVSHLSFMSPEMTPLMPVLQSPLLSLHVSVIMVSYALFAILTLLSVTALIAYKRKSDRAAQMTLMCELLLYPAVFLLCIGIFLGAVWANVSWGTYWSWDPKETWALITMMVYAVPMHKGMIGRFGNPRFYHIYIICAFLSVLVTYFGVNYILGGMHSYA
ncbi:MAG: cytochrome c biogenesis protein CcsA [Prevotella sp.]|nr:cytochrome c biogenesis protein CcsA [Prevotella sp.]